MPKHLAVAITAFALVLPAGAAMAAETSERIGDRSLPVVVFGWPAP